MKQSAWVEQGRQLYRTHANSQFAIGDWVNVGIEAYGRTPAFDVAADITGTNHTRNFFTRCAAVASYYKPALRFPKISFHTYEVLARFPLDFLSTFIPSVAESGRSCAQIYALAVERYGTDLRRGKKLGKRHVVRLPEKLFCALSERASSPGKTHLLIVQVLTDYLGASQNAGKSAPGACPSDVPAPADTQTRPENGVDDEKRPTYEERRAQQIATSSGKPIARKERKPVKLRMLWTECRSGESFKDTENGAVKFRAPGSDKPTMFFSEEEAIQAEAEFFKEKGFHERVVPCPSCSLQKSSSRRKVQVWHVAHVFSSEVRQAAEIDLSADQAEVRATVKDALQQRAQV
jgi:hypothetical protein